MTNQIRITKQDLDRLEELLDGIRTTAMEEGIDAGALEEELSRAEIVERRDIPSDVITMQSQIWLEDLDTGKIAVYRLVWPHARGESGSAARLSVLAPLGMALLGYRTGDVIEWKVPRGVRRVRVVRVLPAEEAEKSAA